ncbi:hypothetical protein SXCC_04427 [Gluconacetobacter sp. SXCC-1]|nr:hypothetical protein SXCC_04427 [Gluconacetobacter sp. SXCC-1]
MGRRPAMPDKWRPSALFRGRGRRLAGYVPNVPNVPFDYRE